MSASTDRAATAAGVREEVIGRDLVRIGRERGGVEIIHRSTCRFARNAKRVVEWDWGNGRPVSEWPDWFAGCLVCSPTTAAPSDERPSPSGGVS